MNDRELLELAAKAAGIGGYWDVSHEWFVTRHTATGLMLDTWNPLADDADALRLAVKLRLDVEWLDSETVFVESAEHIANGDPYAATRRAIVRAAAEIGRQMSTAGDSD